MINYYSTEFIPQGESVGLLEQVISTPQSDHTHAFTDIIFVTRGTGRQTIDGKSYDMKPGSVFFIDRSVPHSIEPQGEAAYSELILAPEFFGKDSNERESGENRLRRIFYTDSEYQPALTLNEEEQAILVSLLCYLARETESRAGDFRSIVKSYVWLISQYLARAVERARSEAENRDPAYIISVTLEYVDKHFTENISQEELAERFRYNPAYFSRMFKKHLGENLSDYITAKRIELAAHLLETTDLSAEQISERVGYRSKPQFYNTFTRYKNVTPRQYRLEHKKSI